MSLSCGGRYLFLQNHFAEPLANYVMGLSFFILFFFPLWVISDSNKKKISVSPKDYSHSSSLAGGERQGTQPFGGSSNKAKSV